MEKLFEGDFTAASISAAVRVAYGGGKAAHPYRAAHGLAFSADCSVSYIFDGGSELTAGPGELIYLPRKSAYTTRWNSKDAAVGDSAAVYCINFLLSDESRSFEPCVFKTSAQGELLSAFIKAESAFRKKDVGFLEETFINLYRIIKLIKTELHDRPGGEREARLLEPALEYIRSNYTSEVITSASLAERVGVSEVYLRRLFDAAFSTSPMVYIRNMRIKYAAELISSGLYSVTDAALMSGFNDVAYFSREFKKTLGVTPRDYKTSVEASVKPQ